MTSEKRLLIDLALLREAYKGREISEIVWIPGGGKWGGRPHESKTVSGPGGAHAPEYDQPRPQCLG